MLELAASEFSQLRDLIERWCGIALDDCKAYLVETRLRHLVDELGCASFGELHDHASRGSGELRQRIIDAIATNETSWFRDRNLYRALAETILPDLAQRAQAEQRPVRVWSAACSTGQEPFSLAILLREMERESQPQGAFSAESFEIVATDISRSALTLARAGRYDPLSMRRGLERDLSQRYFDRDGAVSVLREEVRKLVRFDSFNLLDPMTGLGCFDLVLMRNVLIYFSPQSKRDVLSRMRSALRAEHACFVVGATETLEIYTNDFDTAYAQDAVFYRAKERES